MKICKLSVRNAALIAVTAFALSFTNTAQAARDSSNPIAKQQQVAKQEGDTDARKPDIVEGPHVEGHIAFLHAELNITPDQEQLWAPVAAAMREDVRSLQNLQHQVASDTSKRPSALQYLQNRVKFAQLRAQGEERFLTALTPLYNALSSNQRAAADELLIPNSPDDHP